MSEGLITGLSWILYSLEHDYLFYFFLYETIFYHESSSEYRG